MIRETANLLYLIENDFRLKLFPFISGMPTSPHSSDNSTFIDLRKSKNHNFYLLLISSSKRGNSKFLVILDCRPSLPNGN